jgi:hypothetical protein
MIIDGIKENIALCFWRIVASATRVSIVKCGPVFFMDIASKHDIVGMAVELSFVSLLL